ncbi:unnamed protein product [Calicophoron daubneyi]|uniref:Formyl transferase N-terminal domain-containing protein n=1 Tax=Calicophoron daubneyi TaxID=300641 RepID=A0AAV2TDV5_CALDB
MVYSLIPNVRALRLVYFGSDQYSLTHLRALTEDPKFVGRTRVEHVVTANERTPVAAYCAENRLAYSVWPRDSPNVVPSLIRRIRERQQAASNDEIDDCREDKKLLGLIVSFGRFLPLDLVAAHGYGCINIHPSLLPRWRGPCPLVHTVLVGDEMTGISVIQLPACKHTFDSGSVIYQRSVPLQFDRFNPYNTKQLREYLSAYSIQAMFEVIHHRHYLISEREAISQRTIEDRTGLSVLHACRPTREMGHIDWAHQTADEIVRLFHALSDTTIPLTTQMTIGSNERSDTVADISLANGSPLLVPSPRRPIPTTVGNQLHEAALLLANLPLEFPPGGLVYLRTQLRSNHPLLPFAFIACKSDELSSDGGRTSWIAVPGFRLRWPSSSDRTRSLTAVDFYNGYLTESESMDRSRAYRLPRGIHVFRGFRSLHNPFWPLPQPWTNKVDPIGVTTHTLSSPETTNLAVNPDVNICASKK